MMSRWGIRAKVLLMALTPPTLIALCLGFYLVQTQITGFEDSLIARGKTIANQLAPASEYGVQTRKYELLQDLADAALGELDVKSVTITDNKGRLLAQSRRHLTESLPQALISNLLKLFIRDDIPLIFEAEIKQSSFLTSNNRRRPSLSNNISSLGRVTVELSLRATTLKQSQALLNSALITIITVIVSIILGLWASRTVTAPIVKLNNAVEELEKGKFNTRVAEHSGGELGTLERGFNSMAVSLQQAHEELQEKVDQATQELRETLEAVEIQNVELDIARKKALEASKVKSEFLANMSHEIRTPINGILGFTDLLSHSQLDDEQLDYLNTIKESGANLLAIINDILDFSKIEAGKLVIDNVAFDMRDCVEEVFSLLAPSAYNKNLELVHLIYSDVPLKLHGDPIRIRQVLTNLVHNAIKFTSTGRVVVRIMLDEDKDDDCMIRITVADTGIGLNEEEQKKLFNAFAQADTSTTRRFGGAGLGLVISKKLVEQMGGQIGLESEIDKGSTFWFTLKLNKQRSNEAAEQKAIETPLKGRKILLLDEMPLSRLALRHIFESWNISVTEVDNKHSFISLITADKGWDMAVVGLSRTDLNGQAFQLLMGKVISYKVPVVAMANTVDRNELRQLFLQGASASLPKATRRQTLYREFCRIIQDPEAAINHIVAKKEEAKKESIADTTHITPVDSTLDKLHVLVVDDNRINRKLACTLVLKHNASIAEAENGQEAVNKATSENFDIILMDIHMPIMNGEDASKKIRETLPKEAQPTIVALTANAMPGEKEHLLNSGYIDECLIKPITEEQLLSILNKRIDHNNRNRENSIKIEKEAIDKTDHSNDGLTEELFTMLKAELPTHRTKISSHYEDKDFPNLQDSVHKLHGAASVCGVPELKQACLELENLLRDGNFDNIDQPYQRLIHIVDQIMIE